MPPVVLSLIRRVYTGHGYFGNYRNWKDAKYASSGYDAEHILKKVKEALLKVKRGEAVYERDSVLFDHVEYSWPVLTGLLWIASLNGNRLNVVDFGGSLGSSFFQNRKYLSHLEKLNWSVIEQPHFVRCGQESFQDETLRFYENVEICLVDNRPSVLLLSSVLSYLEDVDDILADILRRNFPYIIIDKTHFVNEGQERITVQRVPERIYKASYPCRFFNEMKLLSLFSAAGYELVESFVSPDSANIPSIFKGFIFKKVAGSVKND
jgi:putative methyltransferase (TIGR04325 family)